MRIVMFSINPLFPGYVMGGAPKQLQTVAVYLGEQGHQVEILCTRTKGSDFPFNWHENVRVNPILRFKQPFPQPYGVPAYDFASILQDVGDALASADRFYMHDGEFLFPYTYSHIPTVVSLRDNVYPETIHGGFLFQAHKLILISDYSRQYYLSTVGRFFPGLADRIEVIHNGVDLDFYRPTPPSDELLNLLPFDPSQFSLILHPHRPEPTKGIFQTLAVTDLLVHQHGLNSIRVLVPRWHEAQLSADLQAFYNSVETDIAARGIGEYIVFHEWLPPRLLPQYYSLGAVTLSPGSFPESFGNAVYESLACGTPSIAARIATHRELLPDHLLDKVDYDDNETMAKIAAEIIQTGRRTSPETLAYLRDHYSINHQRQRYAETILNAEVAAPLTYRHPVMNASTRFKLAPWCYSSQWGRVYHDFRADYASIGALGTLLDQHPEGITFNQAEAAQISRTDLLRWYREGYLIPLQLRD